MLPTAKTALSPVRPLFRALVTTVVPEAVTLDEPAWHELESLVEQALGDRPPALQRQLRIFLRVIQWWPILRHGKRFTALSLSTRTRFLCYLQDHRVERIRVGFWGLRTLALFGYYGRQQAREFIGYRPDPRGWEAQA